MFRIPVEFWSSNLGVPILAYFSPFVWVNNPVSMAGGREVFGYPKTFGNIGLAGSSTAPSVVLKTYCGNMKDKQWKERELISILPHKGGTKKSAKLTVKSEQLMNDWIGGTVKEIFLKQFLAIDSSFQYRSACFEQIATAEYRANKVNAKILPGSFDLTIKNFQSAPLFDELGVEDATGLEVMRVEIDEFVIGNPQILWQAI